MEGLHEFKVLKKKLDHDTLHINANAGKISAEFTMYKYRDKDTRQIVCYIPSLELTGYGADEVKAEEMLKFSVCDYFEYLHTLSAKKIQSELLSLKWKKNTFKNKEFSVAHVDVTGKLKSLNAVGDKVERLSIKAA